MKSFSKITLHMRKGISVLLVMALMIALVPWMQTRVMAANRSDQYSVHETGVYLIRSDGTRSRFFTVNHVRCQFHWDSSGCCTQTFSFDPRLVDLLDLIREHFGRDVVINQTGYARGFRCEAHARSWGLWRDRYPHDGHTFGTAADISISGVSHQAILDFARQHGANSASGAMLTGWGFIDNEWYYFTSSGAMQTGWDLIGDIWYYFQDSGAMATDWLLIDNAWHLFDYSGAWLRQW